MEEPTHNRQRKSRKISTEQLYRQVQLTKPPMLPLAEQIKTIQKELNSYLANTTQDLATFKHKFISSKGHIAQLFAKLKALPPQDKKKAGKLINDLKKAVQAKYTKLQTQLRQTAPNPNPPEQDPTLPPPANTLGSLHPITIMQQKIIQIFDHIGFDIAEGPEIENDWHNFTALNFPPDHPAREMQDTFFLARKTKSKMLLRTQTSSVQVRIMEKNKPPIRILSTGKVFRKEAISARTHCMFHQLEGLYINKQVSFLDLKATIFYFVHALFNEKTPLRFRPSFFPFTEPSAEVDIACTLCKEQGCPACKHTGWVEIAGAGMVDPNVLANCNIDQASYSGFAFGMGIERIAMLYYKIPDTRLFTQNDVRFLQQFVAFS